jgi:hypothetical protein
MRLLLLSFVLLAACGGNPNDPDISKQLASTYEHDGKEIEVYGELAFGNTVTVEDDTVTTPLYWSKGLFSGNETVLQAIELDFGSGPNMVTMPARFKASDITIYDDNGQRLLYSDYFKLRGRVEYTARDSGSYDYVVRDVHMSPVPFNLGIWLSRNWIILAFGALVLVGVVAKIGDVIKMFRGERVDPGHGGKVRRAAGSP